MKKVSVIIPVYNQEKLVIRALSSVPKEREDIEVIIIDDGSTDNTFKNLCKYIEENYRSLNITLLHNEENKGVGYTMNKGYDAASGEYVVALGSDDYFITENFLKVIKTLDGTDMVYFNLEANNGSIWKVDKKSSRGYVGSVKFIKRSFLGDTRCPDKRQGEDWDFYHKLLKKNPTEKFTDIAVKHYNYPREGSLTWRAIHGDNPNKV